MKIAVVTDDGKTISAHFGRARHFLVATIVDGQIVDREMRLKASHHDFAHAGHEDAEHGDAQGHEHHQGHGRGAGAQHRHAQMFATIADCSVVVARGMGWGAYDGLRDACIRPIVTPVRDIDEAVHAVVEGRLADHPERLD